MEFAVIFALAVMGFAAYFFVELVSNLPGIFLRRKVARLGEVSGLTHQEVTSVLGPPTCVTPDGKGKSLYQWIARGYHVVLSFDGDTCERVSHVIVD
jgi:hypothetical protein